MLSSSVYDLSVDSSMDDSGDELLGDLLVTRFLFDLCAFAKRVYMLFVFLYEEQ